MLHLKQSIPKQNAYFTLVYFKSEFNFKLRITLNDIKGDIKWVFLVGNELKSTS